MCLSPSWPSQFITISIFVLYLYYKFLTSIFTLCSSLNLYGTFLWNVDYFSISPLIPAIGCGVLMCFLLLLLPVLLPKWLQLLLVLWLVPWFDQMSFPSSFLDMICLCNGCLRLPFVGPPCFYIFCFLKSVLCETPVHFWHHYNTTTCSFKLYQLLHISSMIVDLTEYVQALLCIHVCHVQMA